MRWGMSVENAVACVRPWIVACRIQGTVLHDRKGSADVAHRLPTRERMLWNDEEMRFSERTVLMEMAGAHWE